MLIDPTKFWWQFIVLGIAMYVAILFTGRSLRQSTPTATVSRIEERKTKDIKSSLFEEERRMVETYCEDSSNICYMIEDRPLLENNNLVVQRVLLYKDVDRPPIFTVELDTPAELTRKNFDPRQWSINKLFVPNFYTRIMIGMSFVLEALQFDPTDLQNVLLVGLGGETQNNFLSEVDFINVNLTTVEPNPLMVTMATDWFGLVETRTNNVFVEDWKDFLHRAAQRGEKYKSIIFDNCNQRHCPTMDLVTPTVIQSIARILDDDGVLTVNIVSSKDYSTDGEDVISTIEMHFSSCFLLRYSGTQRLLVCTQREGWSFHEQRTRFTQNLRNVDDRFDFGIADFVLRDF